RSCGDRSPGRHSAQRDRWSRPRRSTWYDRPEGIWRTRVLANGQLQSARRNRAPLRIDIGFRKRAPLDRDSRVTALWNTRTKTAMATQIIKWRAVGFIRAH